MEKQGYASNLDDNCGTKRCIGMSRTLEALTENVPKAYFLLLL